MLGVTVVPEAVVTAASDLTDLGSTINAANAAAAAPTISVVPAAQDEVSTAIAALFGRQARQFQALAAKAAAFHERFVQALRGGAASYVEAETANVRGLMGGAHAAAARVAAATPAFNIGSIFSFLGEIAPATENFLDRLGEKAAADAKIAESAARAMRVKRIIGNGLRLIGKDGALLYTDGREIVAIGGRYPFDLYTEGYLYQYRRVVDAWGWTDQNLKSIFGSEIQVVSRGEGLAQTYLQKIGNRLYQVEINAQGQILRTLHIRNL